MATWQGGAGRNLGELQARRQREEFRDALRALLMQPLMAPVHPDFPAVRRQAERLRDWFAREAGWVLHVEREGARLYKRPADLSDATRGLAEFDRRRYVLLCLACAVLERADPQITLHLLGDKVMTMAADPALAPIGVLLDQFNDAQYRLVQAAQQWRRAQPEFQLQRSRETEALARLREREALARLREREERLAAARTEAEEARARFEVLHQAVGAQVDDLRRQLAEARLAVRAADTAQSSATEERRLAGEARVSAEAKAEAADSVLRQRFEARAGAMARLRNFAASSLLSSALPDIEMPDPHGAWSIEPALTLARRIEQALAHIADDEAAWTRVQRQITEDLQELQRALSALGHQAPAEPSDWGLVVQIIFHNRPERPDQIVLRLADDIAERGELLSAKESEVLENYLQAEIASEVQRLLRAAEQRVQAINKELHKRPTSTGVRYRLQWQALGEDEGAPVGLEAARTRLANTSADLWSAEDRRVVGAMLQQRIAAERERGDADPGRHAVPILDGTRATAAAAWSINSRVRSTTAAGTVSASNACRMGSGANSPGRPPAVSARLG